MASTQMNVRIDADVKRRGDAAFARVGRTPTDVVRKVWEFAARNEFDEEALREALAAFEPPEDIAQRQRKLEAYRSFLNQLDEWHRQMGIDDSSEEVLAAVNVDYRELREEYFNERYFSGEGQ